MYKTSMWLAALCCLPVSLLSGEACAQENPNFKADLARAGFDAGLSVTLISEGVLAGDGDRDWQTGGKVDATLRFDGTAVGLWSGLSVSVHQELAYGEDVNAQGDGSLLPVNAAMGFPRLGGNNSETSIVITQAFSDRLSVSAGKFNMLDAASRTPLLGGGGINTFSHLGLAGPITGITPPYLLGVMGTLRTDTVIATAMIYDPRNAQDSGVIADPFTDGVTASLSTTFPVSLGGHPGFQALRAVYSSQRGLDLNDIPELALPPEAEAAAGETSGRWYLAYSFQQYLFQQAQDPTRGWGVFGQFAISDGNPNTIESSVLVGIGGDSPVLARPRDRWGIGYFRYNLSGALLDGLVAAGIDNLRGAEHGIEVFYNMALTGNLRLTGNLNYIAPGEAEREDAIFAGARLQASF